MQDGCLTNISMETQTFTCLLENLGKICDYITGFAIQAGFNESQVYAVQLSVDEAATNIIEHAYCGDLGDDLEITCEVLNNGLKVILHDHGRPFEPELVPEPVVDVPLEKLKSRGLGIFLMRKMMDEVRFEFTPDHGNTLTMVKYR
jgi:anti-sigma regulatory factor (Ser/Thr protein kinase)